jgi:hypothetical protein
MHARSCQDPLPPLSFLSTTRQASTCTQPTPQPHLSASGVSPIPLSLPLLWQTPRQLTLSSTPPLCRLDRASMRNTLPAPRVFPRRALSLSRAPPPPSHPQPVPATSIWTRPRLLPHALSPSLSFMHASSTPPQHPTGAATPSLSPVTMPPPLSNTCVST